MKAKYIIASLVAACALAIGCTKETPTLLDEVQVDSSYIGLSNNEGNNSKTITVTAKDSWTINSIPEWLTINPQSGSAGETKVTFSAEKATATRENTIKITCAGKEQTIIVKQEAEKVEPKTLTVDQAIEICNALADKEIAPGEYRIKGIVCSIVDISVQYGNATFWISDNGKFENGKSLEVYRALWLNGAAVKAGDSVDVGDEVIIEGKIMKYGTTPETAEKQAYVYQINKSLIKCDSLVYNGAKLEALPLEGGSFEAALVCKGNGVSVTIPDDAKSWLSVTGIQTSGDKATVTFLAAKNDGGDRSADLTFVTTSEGKEYTAAASVAQKGAILEVTIAEFNAAPKSSTVYRISGFVTKVDDATKGNFHLKDYSAETYAYKATNFADYSNLKVGDLVTIIGNRDEYNTTIELTNGVIENVKTVTVKTVAEADALEDDDKTDPKNYIMITGTVKDGTAKTGHKFDLTNYGNFDLADETGEIYVYGVSTGWKGAKGNGAFATLGVKEGDKITIIAYKTSYNGMNQLVGYYYSHEAGETPEPPTPSGNIVLTFPDDNSDNNKVGSYTDTWTAKSGSQEFTIANFNNNNWNGWSFIKCGRKANESTASITTTISDKVSKVIVTFDNVTAADVTSAKLIVGTSEYTAELKAGAVEYVVATPAADQTYKLEFVCKTSSENKNGFVVINKLEYVVEK